MFNSSTSALSLSPRAPSAFPGSPPAVGSPGVFARGHGAQVDYLSLSPRQNSIGPAPGGGQHSDVVFTVMSALSAVMGSGNNNHERRAAQQYLDEFKVSQGCILHIPSLLSCEHAATVRHFALQCLEHTIKFQWHTLSAMQQHELRMMAMSIIANGTLDITEEALYIREKAAAVVTEVARLEWPQNWPDFLEEVVELAGHGVTQAELVCMVLRGLSESVVAANEVYLYSNPVPPERRKVLLGALHLAQEGLAAFLVEVIQAHYGQYVDTINVNEQGSEDVLAGLLAVCRAATEALVPLVSWLPVSVFYEEKVGDMLCALLDQQDLRKYAADALLIALKSRHDQENQGALVMLLDHVETFRNVLGGDGADMELEHAFHKSFVPVLVALAFVQCRHRQQIHPSFPLLLEVLVSVTEHSSLLISRSATSLWSFMFSNSLLEMAGDVAAAVCDAVLNLLASKSQELHHGMQNVDEYFLALDFDDEEEITLVIQDTKDDLRALAMAVTSFDPKVTVHYFASTLQELVCSSSIDGDAVEVVGSLLKTVLFRVPAEWFSAEHPEGRAMLESVDVCLTSIMELSFNDASLAKLQATLVPSFIPYLKHHSHNAPAVVAKLFETAVFRGPKEEDVPLMHLSASSVAARQAACDAMNSVALSASSALLDMFESMIAHVEELVDADALLPNHKVILLKSLAAASRALEKVEDQCSFLSSIVSPLGDTWQSEDMAGPCGDVQALLSTLAIVGYDDYAALSSPGVETFKMTLKFLIDVQAGILHQIATSDVIQHSDLAMDLVGPLLERFLPNLLALIGTLHELTKDSVRSQIDSPFDLCLAVTPPAARDLQSQVGGEEGHVLKTVGGMSAWLDDLRTSCCVALGSVAMLKDLVFSNDDLMSAITDVLTLVPDLRSHHLRPLLRSFLKPFVMCCPGEHFERHVMPALATLLPHLEARLEEEWQAHAAYSEGRSDLSEMEQSALENELRLLTRDTVFLMSQIAPPPAPPGAGQPQGPRADRCRLVLFDEGTGFPFVSLLLRILSWPDSVAAAEAARVCRMILPLLLDSDVYLPVIAQDFTRAAIEGLAETSDATCQRQLLSLFRDVYFEIVPRAPQQLRGVVMSLPDMDVPRLQSFEGGLAAADDSTTQLRLVKVLLGDVIGANTATSVLFKRQPSALAVAAGGGSSAFAFGA